VSQQLNYLEETINNLKALQQQNAEVHHMAEAMISNNIQLEIDSLLRHTRAIDTLLGLEIGEVKECYERTKAEHEAVNSVEEPSDTNGFDDFIASCLSDIEDRDDLVGAGEVATFNFHKDGPNGGRRVTVIVGSGSEHAAAGEVPAE